MQRLGGAEIVDRIDALLRQRNETRKALSIECQIPTQTISNWKVRGTSPTVADLAKVAKYLNVTLDYLATGSETAPDSESVAIANDVQRLDARDRKLLKDMIDNMKAHSKRYVDTHGIEFYVATC